MFVCGKCQRVTAPREPATMMVVATRKVSYRNEVGEVVGNGHEVVKEEKWCLCCAKERL